jgi:hypothetical protein
MKLFICQKKLKKCGINMKDFLGKELFIDDEIVCCVTTKNGSELIETKILGFTNCFVKTWFGKISPNKVVIVGDIK